MSDKIHVLFVMEDLCFGGTQRQMVELACRLDRTRFHVSMLVLTGRTDLDAQVEQAGIRVEYLGRSRKVNPFFFALMPARPLHGSAQHLGPSLGAAAGYPHRGHGAWRWSAAQAA